jgi:predicted acyltransferase (DUF342 family)
MKIKRQRFHDDTGSVLVLSMLMLLALGGLAATLSVVNLSLHKEHVRAREDLRSFCVAEAGLNEAYAVLEEKSVAGVRAMDYPSATSSGSYRVELLDGRDDPEIDLDRVRLRSVGEAGRDSSGVQLMVHHVPNDFFRFAIFGADGVVLNSNVMVDSYDPADGPYPDDVEYVNDFGNVGSYTSIEIDANTSIYGDALVGEDGVFDDASNTYVSGDQEAGEINETMPVITVPTMLSSGTLAVGASRILTAGNYRYDVLMVARGMLTLQGPMTLVVDDLTMLSGTGLQIDTTNGPVKIYATGNVRTSAGSRIRTNNDSARDFEVMITSDNITGGKIVDLQSNSQFMGTIYAPNASLRIPSNFEIFGALKAKQVEMASNTQIHFDENLLYDPNAADIYEVVSWRRLSQEEIGAIEAVPLP